MMVKMNNIRKASFYSIIAVMAITMITSNQLSIYASPTTEDDGYTYPDDSSDEEKEEIDEQEQEAWEDAGRPGDNDNENDDDNDDKTNDLPRCKLGVVVDCVLNDLGQTCEVGSTEDACQDIYGGVYGSPERDQNGQLINKPNPYCDQPHTGPCHDRKDYYQGGPNDGLYPCNDGTNMHDWRDCKDATKKDTSSSSDNDNDIPECVNGLTQKCVISAIGLICRPGYDLSNPSIVGGGHACQDIYAGIYKPQPEPEPESKLKNCGDGIVAVSCGVGRYWCSGGDGDSFQTNDYRDCEAAEPESKPGLYTCNDGTKKADWRDCDYRADGSYPCSDGTYEVDLKACNIAARLKNNR
jgi:hypothetical protein